MSKYGLVSVYIVVGIIFLVDRVIGPSSKEKSRDATLHSPQDIDNEHVLNLSTIPSLDFSINSDNERGTPGSIPTTTFPATVSDIGNTRRHDTQVDTKLNNTKIDTRLNNTTADTIRHKITDDTIRHDTAINIRRHNTTFHTGLHNTTDDSGLRNTTDDPGLHNTAVGMEDVNTAPLFPNDTPSERTDFIDSSAMENNISIINELQMENHEKTQQLPFDIDRISNDSNVWNHTFHGGKNRQINCSMIKNVVFLFTIGRKMPVYIDILCLVIGAIGIIGNLATVVIVAINLKLRKPYFLTILTLAVADLLSIILTIGTMFFEFESTIYMHCVKPSFFVLISFCFSIQINSMLQVVLIAVIKFLLLVYPIKSRTYVTNNLIVALFFVLLSVSVCCAFLASYLIMQKVKANEDPANIIVGLMIMIIMPSNLVIILSHCIKVIKLKKSQSLKKEIQKINTIFSIILVIFIADNAHKVGNQIIFKLTRNTEIVQMLNKSVAIAAFIQHACNPFVYAAFTPLVQKPWQRLKEKFRRH